MPHRSDYSPNYSKIKSKRQLEVTGNSLPLAAAIAFVKQAVPNADFRVAEDHYTSSSGVTHVNFKQTLHGIDVDNADLKVNIARDGDVFSFSNSFFVRKLPSSDTLAQTDLVGPIAALNAVAKILGLSIDVSNSTLEPHPTDDRTFVAKSVSGVDRDPIVKLAYVIDGNGELQLSWRVETDTTHNWLRSYIDARNNDKIYGVYDHVFGFSSSFGVFPWDVADPTDGSRAIVHDPWDLEASPFTWFGDGATNYSTTWGNNAHAQADFTGTGSNQVKPESGAKNFVYPYSDKLEPEQMVNASVTQLFYTINKYHDLLWYLGFNEKAGNFQTNNDGRGGKGGDAAVLNAQDGFAENGAGFVTFPDGSLGQMRLGVWNSSSPKRDSAFDTSVVLHEFTHGVSMRMTGGPANTGCLSGVEAGGMGEGWSDFMATAIHTKKRYSNDKIVYFGRWISNKPQGYRKYPYSTNMTVNPLTYASNNGVTEVHDIGTMWASVLYEMLWNLIDKHGNTDAQLPKFDAKGVPSDGKYLAMKLVIDSLALQPCNPNMVQSRDAIVDADVALTGGANKCELWKAFAKRGLGRGAKFGDIRKEDFTLPAGVCR
ncbi:extracellular elastinolytic metalloproteinase precursor [Cordyceps javanica]|uniref:Extracellular metalloproteinase n=1 Tax=Cordyceps javanica TaxID=43265 RepID=A0A545UMU7_9HYPO|nr:extracellular elastinolytic metalloproteinase precursor [Cordyceps javanica]TQW02412.1 extracellular elastinolytic metalloproteinase precursor [Cordyceps javanica]